MGWQTHENQLFVPIISVLVYSPSSLILRLYFCGIFLCQKLLGWRTDITIQHGQMALRMSTKFHQTYTGIHDGFITGERATCLLFWNNVKGQCSLQPCYHGPILSLQDVLCPFLFKSTFGHSSAPVFLSRRPAPGNFSASQQHSSVTQCINTMDEGDVEAPPQCFPSASSKKHASFSQSSCPTSAHNQFISNEIINRTAHMHKTACWFYWCQTFAFNPPR